MELEDDLPPVVEDEGAIDAPVEDQQSEAITPPSLEDLAGEMGWRPKDDWRGDPDKWKPAHEFVRSTVDVNHKLGNRLKGLEEQIGHLSRTSATVTEQALAKQRAELLAKRDEAFEVGDRDAFKDAERELEALPVIQPAQTNYIDQFKAKNDWFEKDRDATVWAVSRAGELGNQGISPERQLQIVEREAKQLFPELFPEPVKPAKAAPLTPPGNRGSAPAKKGFSALPKEAQATALDYEKRGIGNREEFAQIYFEEQGS